MPIFIVLLVFGAVAAALLCPLVFHSRIKPLGKGLETNDPVIRWEREKNRLITQMQDNDLALAEGRIDPDAHQRINLFTSAEADRALDRLRRIRSSFSLVEDQSGLQASMATRLMIPVASLAFLLSFGVSWFASLSDIDMNVSPHTNGQVPITNNADVAGTNQSLENNAMPDVTAMVARLETRIAGGQASEKDYAMLLRSYGVLDRQAETFNLLNQASEQYPDNLGFRLGYLRAGVDRTDLTAKADEMLLKNVTDFLATDQGLDEVRWYRCLLLVRLNRSEEALDDLKFLQTRLPPEHPAYGSVQSLIVEIQG